MAKRPLRVFQRGAGGAFKDAEPVKSVPVYRDGADADRRSITQQVLEHPDVYRARTEKVSLTRYEELLHCIYDAVLITDGRGQIREVNSRAEQSFAMSQEALATRNIVDLVSGADADLLKAIRKNVTDRKFTVLEAVCVTGDDRRFYSEIVVNRVGRSEDDALCFFVRDVSRRKQAEEELQEANEKLLAAEKVQARLDTLSTLHYELNNPLQILTCLAELDKNEEYKRQIGRIVSVLDKLRRERPLETVADKDGTQRYQLPSDKRLQPCDAGRLLIVDDEAKLREMFVRALSAYFPGLKVETASDGREAVRAFTAGHHGVIIMDVSMPVMDGEASFAEIKALCEKEGMQIPCFIFCTGFNASSSLKEIMGDGTMHTCLEKPLTMARMEEVVKDRLSRIQRAT